MWQELDKGAATCKAVNVPVWEHWEHHILILPRAQKWLKMTLLTELSAAQDEGCYDELGFHKMSKTHTFSVCVWTYNVFTSQMTKKETGESHTLIRLIGWYRSLICLWTGKEKKKNTLNSQYNHIDLCWLQLRHITMTNYPTKFKWINEWFI